MTLSDGPFVLLDDARALGAAPGRLYREPIETMTAYSKPEVREALCYLRTAQAQGLHVAGFISYEASYALEPKFSSVNEKPAAQPLLWFGLFHDYTDIASGDVPALLPSPNSAWIGAPVPQITPGEHAVALDRIQRYIASGDIYQANFTFPCDVPFQGHPLALYAGLRDRAKTGYGGIVFTGKEWLLSLSPELFFALQDGKLTTRPMKGTARADSDPLALANDAKQRAENLMIVDLLRNDLSRVTKAGTVQVPALFAVESYPTVRQMTSTITARLQPGLGATDVLRAIFPCGSITGAPKIRAMEIISEIETGPRNAYTGSIGRIDVNGDAAFNVAIRTLHIPVRAQEAALSCATLGLGSGIVADSESAAEWQECMDKGAFVASAIAFDLIETMRFDPDAGITLLDGHITRLSASASQFGFVFNRHDLRNALQAAMIRHTGARKLRLRLSKLGAVAIEISALPAKPDGAVSVSVVPLPFDPRDFRLRHKTSDRGIYDDARKASGTFEVLFTDHHGFLTEGSFTNIFVPRNGVLLTPKVQRGLIPGVFRAALLATGDAEEADLTARDLRDDFFIGNALRGLLPARIHSL